MKRSNNRNARLPGLLKGSIALGLCLLMAGCYYPMAVRDISRDGSHPWWCVGANTTALSDSECLSLSLQLDILVGYAEQYPTVADFVADGATPGAFPAFAGQPGVAYSKSGVITGAQFNITQPNVLYYSGSSSSDRLIAVGWHVDGPPADAFPGDADVWRADAALGANERFMTAWIIRGHENHPDVFAASHPCTSAVGSTLSSTLDACYVASHTVPLEIMVTNDDGIGAHGIDALVEGLKTVPGVTFEIVAPAVNQSGTGGTTTPGPETASPGQTLSGEVGVAVNGTPADSVIYGTSVLLLSPDLVMSGINDGQNLAVLGDGFSGTVGAARRALAMGVPALALSQGGVSVTPDFPAGVAASLALLEDWRLGLAGSPYMELPNLNIPSCNGTGTITGNVETIVGVDLSSATLNGGNYFSPQNCSSGKTVFLDDLDAFLNGWTSIADMGAVQPPNFP